MKLGGLTPHLILLALVALTGVIAKSSDYKQCCANNGVSSTCQKLCDLDIDLQDKLEKKKYASCEKYFGVLLKCGADEKDYTQCCQSNAIMPDCTPLCNGAAPKVNASTKFEDCYDEIDFIFDCFDKDHHDIPYPPKEVTTHRGTTEGTFIVTWTPPDVKPELIEFYTVYYGTEDEEDPESIKVDGKTLEANVKDIKPDTQYIVWVCSGTEDGGESHNSNETTFNSNPDGTPHNRPTHGKNEPTDNEEDPGDYKQCCAKNGVSSLCQKLCTLDIDIQDKFDNPKYEICEKDYGVLLTCGARQTDHTKCCQSNAIMPVCTPLCNGAAPQGNASAKFDECYDEMDFIFDCFDVHHHDIPYPPRGVTTHSGTSAGTFLVTWTAPDLDPELVEFYTVYYIQQYSTDDPDTVHVNGKTFEATVTDIEPDTVYDVWVCSGTQEGGESHNSNETTFNPTNELRKREGVYNIYSEKDKAGIKRTVHKSQRYVRKGQKTLPTFQKTVPTTLKFVPTTLKTVPKTPKTMPIKKLADPGDYKKCCAKNGVSSLCQKLCDLDIDLEDKFDEPRYESCKKDYGVLLTCGARQTDHTKCCQSNAIKPVCTPMCNGLAPQVNASAKFEECYDEMDFIFDCFDLHHNDIPYPPRNVMTHSGTSAGTFIVTWTTPDLNPELVEFYSVYYMPQYSSNDPEVVHVNGKIFEATVKNIEPNTVYQVWVCSATQEGGESHNSNETTFNPTNKPTRPENFVQVNKAESKRVKREADSEMTVSTTLQTVPTTQKTVPTTQKTVPTNQKTVPTTQKTVPTTQKTVPTTQKIVPTKKLTDAKDYKTCCADHNVSRHCLRLCDLDIDLMDYFDDPDYTECKMYFGELLTCGARDTDHTQCCQSNALKPDCVPLCDGVLSAAEMNASAKLQECYDEIDFIIDCFDGHHHDIPYPPRNVTTHTGPTADILKVTWGRPDLNPELVEFYNVYYMPQYSVDDPEVVHTVDGKTFEKDVEDIEPNTVYNVWVCSATKQGGESHNSNETTFQPMPTPAKPVGVTVLNITQNSAVIVWLRPTATLVNATSFSVYYRSVNTADYTTVKNVQGLSYELKDLNPSTGYVAYVTGVISEGEGPHSKTVSFTSDGKGPSPPGTTPKSDANKGDNTKTLALAAGIPGGVVALVALIFLIWFVVHRQRLQARNQFVRLDEDC